MTSRAAVAARTTVAKPRPCGPGSDDLQSAPRRTSAEIFAQLGWTNRLTRAPATQAASCGSPKLELAFVGWCWRRSPHHCRRTLMMFSAASGSPLPCSGVTAHDSVPGRWLVRVSRWCAQAKQQTEGAQRLARPAECARQWTRGCDTRPSAAPSTSLIGTPAAAAATRADRELRGAAFRIAGLPDRVRALIGMSPNSVRTVTCSALQRMVQLTAPGSARQTRRFAQDQARSAQPLASRVAQRRQHRAGTPFCICTRHQQTSRAPVRSSASLQRATASCSSCRQVGFWHAAVGATGISHIGLVTSDDAQEVRSISQLTLLSPWPCR